MKNNLLILRKIFSEELKRIACNSCRYLFIILISIIFSNIQSVLEEFLDKILKSISFNIKLVAIFSVSYILVEFLRYFLKYFFRYICCFFKGNNNSYSKKSIKKRACLSLRLACGKLLEIAADRLGDILSIIIASFFAILIFHACIDNGNFAKEYTRLHVLGFLFIFIFYISIFILIFKYTSKSRRINFGDRVLVLLLAILFVISFFIYLIFN